MFTNEKSQETLEEKAKRLGVPLIKEKVDRDCSPNPIVGICGKCGLEIHQVMFFSCLKSGCPIQPKVTA